MHYAKPFFIQFPSTIKTTAMKANYLFTSESVSEGHPDKICDQVSDAILDAWLKKDPYVKLACECLITTGRLVIAGEVSSHAVVDVVAIAKEVLRDIGYDDESVGFNYQTAQYLNWMQNQSAEINHSVTHGGAGDQGLMFGYASDETPELMPLPIMLSHRLVEALSSVRKNGTIPWLLPDAKSQVTIAYENGRPVAVDKLVISTQHLAGIVQEEIRETIIRDIAAPLVAQYLPGSEPEFIINPSGSFTIGGPHGDTGLTGRKIIVDSYGGSCPHGGGAYSGKDGTKVDRSAAYAARFVAKHIVASGLARRCTIQLSYAIGKAQPLSVYADTHGTGLVPPEKIIEAILSLFDLSPTGIINTLGLRRPIFRATAAYGHFGKPGLPWEDIDQEIIEQLRAIRQ
jgi:S-adenosylmethionine synthetase